MLGDVYIVVSVESGACQPRIQSAGIIAMSRALPQGGGPLRHEDESFSSTWIDLLRRRLDGSPSDGRGYEYSKQESCPFKALELSFQCLLLVQCLIMLVGYVFKCERLTEIGSCLDNWLCWLSYFREKGI